MAFCALLDACGETFTCLFNQEGALQPAHQGATGTLSTVQKCTIVCLLLHPLKCPLSFSISVFAYWKRAIYHTDNVFGISTSALHFLITYYTC